MITTWNGENSHLLQWYKYWASESRQSMNNYKTTLNSKTRRPTTLNYNFKQSVWCISQLYTTVFRDFSYANSVYGVSEVNWICVIMSFSMFINAQQFSLFCDMAMVGRCGVFRSLSGVWMICSPVQSLTIKERYIRRATSTYGNTDWTLLAFNISEFCSAAPNVSISLSACEWQQGWKCESSETSSSILFLYVEARAWYSALINSFLIEILQIPVD